MRSIDAHMYELKGEVILHAKFLGCENGGFVEALRMLTQGYLLGTVIGRDSRDSPIIQLEQSLIIIKGII
jgi:hypothetical protein